MEESWQLTRSQRRGAVWIHRGDSRAVATGGPRISKWAKLLRFICTACGVYLYEEEFDYESETETESEIESETDFQSDPETAPTTEPETEPEDERGPVVAKRRTFDQSLTERLNALRLQSPDASPSRAQPSTRESESPRQGEEPEPEDKDPRDPEESEQPKKQQRRRRCKPKKPTRRDPSPESPSKRGPIPIRRH